MPSFRNSTSAVGQPITAAAVAALAGRMVAPAHFFVGPNLTLEWDHVATEAISWEVFRGRLLDAAHTRQRRTFAAWNVYAVTPQGRAAEPLLSLKWDAACGELHVVRGVESYAWEGYDAGGNVILSRERRKWVRELAATIRPGRLADLGELEDELACRLFLAVVGSSRLPLSSAEAPLTPFSFGELFCCYRPQADPASGPVRGYLELVAQMLGPTLARHERSRLLETFLHAAPAAEMAAATQQWVRRWSELGQAPSDLAALLRTLFNDVSLSPYTDLVDKTLALVQALEACGYFQPADGVDFLGHLLRQVGRHLTGYDLVTFHHRGANYPDALLLDAILAAYLDRVERRPDLFLPVKEDEAEDRRHRLRRRALRQGYLLRRRYEGHPVPDRPTSPGENSRVLPPEHPRVPEEQVLQPGRRARRLYAGDPLDRRLGPDVRALLRQSFTDLEHAEERRELGAALFIDRPLGGGKHPAEPDETLLLASVAYSRLIAEERLRALAAELGLAADAPEVERLRSELHFPGLPLDAIGPAAKPGTVTLADAARSAPDFVFLWTTRAGIDALLRQFDFSPLAEQVDLSFLTAGRVLVARSAQGPGLRLYDEVLRPRLELEAPTADGYEGRAGEEYPAGGLLVVRLWRPLPEQGTEDIDLHGRPVRLPLR
jgi:hypothetical protein